MCNCESTICLCCCCWLAKNWSKVCCCCCCCWAPAVVGGGGGEICKCDMRVSRPIVLIVLCLWCWKRRGRGGEREAAGRGSQRVGVLDKQKSTHRCCQVNQSLVSESQRQTDSRGQLWSADSFSLRCERMSLNGRRKSCSLDWGRVSYGFSLLRSRF